MNTEQKLISLQDTLIDSLLEKAKEGKLTKDEMNVTLALLKQNNIQAEPVQGSPIGILKELPFKVSRGDDRAV